ncbi:PelA/Pel-15E family pectate lyase [Gracilibacillus halotolerans]|uniref:PelA/Pel-15E family pectate lyase n=1 Tax=Gracilibacillus halotolerans TaxID=74386 RepID=A0A841RNG4_9BACI|nr:pectate lyase [Gracilibacillus halotolerans]MBB6513422.1 PelA/Pel-15E family pectate lyase [Gracilibacillus halotolerans]
MRKWTTFFIILLAIPVLFIVFEARSLAKTIDFPGDIFEAEKAKGEGFIVDNKHLGFTGEGFIDFQPNEPGGYIEWDIPIEDAGEYILAFRYAHGKPDNRHAQLEVNGNVVVEQLDFPQSGEFDDYTYTSAKTQLSSGTHKVRLTATADEGGANIDHLYVYRAVNILTEAEDGSGEGFIIDNKHQGFTGEGFIDYNPNVPGGYVEWTVDIPVSATYFIDFRYAHAGGSNRPAEISINGEPVEELSFPPTGDWADWRLESTSIHFESGSNVIRLTSTGAEGGGNIDHFRIHNDNESDSSNTPVDTELMELEEWIDGLTMLKLKQLGIIHEQEKAGEELITGMELLALINREFGLEKQAVYKNIRPQASIGPYNPTDWEYYVVDIAQSDQYVPDFLWDEIDFTQTLSKNHLAMIVGDLMDYVSEEEEGKGMMGKLARQGMMNPNHPKNHGIKSNMTWNEAKAMVASLIEESEQESDTLFITNVRALTPHLIAVTVNGELNEVDIDDIKLSVPTGSWNGLTPLLNKHLNAPKAGVTQDKFGNTVILFETIEQIDGEFYFIEKEEGSFTGDLDAAKELADNIITWQMENGGWSKGMDHSRKWDGEEPRSEWVNSDGTELGMIDNDATVNEMRFLAEVYTATGEEKYRDSFQKGLEFLFDLQYETGGFAQVYPRRGNYSDMVTFNDEAMIRVLNMFEDIVHGEYPYNSDIVTEDTKAAIEASINRAVHYILNAQIEANGVKTAWGQQHHPETYEPVAGRSYEHASISGKESVAIVQFLMERMDESEEIRDAVEAALAWYDETKLEGIRYVSGGDENGNYFVEDENAITWYRFYEIGTNKPIFSGRDGVIKHDIHEIEEERRNGYQWGGSYGHVLLEMAKTTGYFVNRIYAQTVGSNNTDEKGRVLTEGQFIQLKDFTETMNRLENKLVVAKDGTGNFDTVQAAIDAIPEQSEDRIEVFIKNGIYEEVVTIPADKPNVHLIGEDSEDTIIRYDNYAGKDNGVGGTLGTSGSATAFFRSNDVTIESLTIENSFDESIETEGKQAVAVYAAGERMVFNNVRLLGNQDTLFAHSGTQYYYDSYIEGDVDFIFGGASAVFENCTIHSVDRGSDTNNGYITAASTQQDQYGFLILRSELTSDAKEGTVYLGRPWQPSSNPTAIANVVYKESYLGEHIKEEGWTEMGGFQPEDARLYEYNNEGPGVAINNNRRQLTDEDATEYTVENVLGGWVPTLN